MTTLRKKLIEVALPLEAINVAAAREKSIRHGHPSTLHLWWARRPLAAARAVLFAQMVDDPSAHPERFPTEAAQQAERQRLFALIEELVKWENTTNEQVLEQARAEIRRSWRWTCEDNAGHPRAAELFNPDTLPAFHDPFAGGGSIPLEAQRLGLEAWASDLNPVAVLINKAMIEIPPKFAGQAPVNPESRDDLRTHPKAWKGAQGLAEDVRHYGKWMRDQAATRIGHLYPPVQVTEAMARERPDLQQYVGRSLTVIAWIWARTVPSPNPAFAHVAVPLASTFLLSTKQGKEAYVEPVLEGDQYRFEVKVGTPPASAKAGTKLSRGANFQCLLSGTPIEGDFIKAQGVAGRMGARLMAIVCEGDRGRVYLSPQPEHEVIAASAAPTWRPETPLPNDPRNFWTLAYGLTTFGDLFTPRQLVALNTFCDLVQEARNKVRQDALAAGLPDDGRSLEEGGTGAQAYADCVSIYLSSALDRVIDRHSSVTTWDSSPTKLQLRNTFARQAIPMCWDFGEGNPFCTSSGAWRPSIDWVSKALSFLSTEVGGIALQHNAVNEFNKTIPIYSFDPPYFDNISYADLSDFFYVWLRRSLHLFLPSLFSTVSVPKVEELVASPYRHGSVEKAEVFFLEGMTKALENLARQTHPGFPVTIYYAFKQAEQKADAGTVSTGWETFLDAVIRAGFELTGTWPMRTELGNRMIGSGTNALASSIVLVCRPRPADAPTATRREFLAALKAELPQALRDLQRGNIAPVDLAQAAIGPGMAVFTRYARVLDASGAAMPVRQALAAINQTLDEVLAEQEGDFDADTRWAVAWFEQYGFEEGEYGVAETLSTAKNTSVGGMVEAGILLSKAGKVRLLRPEELPPDWDPARDARLTVWEMVHHLVRVLEAGGEAPAAALVAALGAKAEVARELAYRLYTVCERKKRAREAMAYNGLVQSWPEVMRLGRERGGTRAETQLTLQ